MSAGKAKAPRAILFDWDNTLVDSWGTIHEALVRTFTADGPAAWTLAETKARVRSACAMLSRASSASAGTRRASSISTAFTRSISSGWPRCRGAAELLG